MFAKLLKMYKLYRGNWPFRGVAVEAGQRDFAFDDLTMHVPEGWTCTRGVNGELHIEADAAPTDDADAKADFIKVFVLSMRVTDIALRHGLNPLEALKLRFSDPVKKGAIIWTLQAERLVQMRSHIQQTHARPVPSWTIVDNRWCVFEPFVYESQERKGIFTGFYVIANATLVVLAISNTPRRDVYFGEVLSWFGYDAARLSKAE